MIVGFLNNEVALAELAGDLKSGSVKAKICSTSQYFKLGENLITELRSIEI